MKKITTLLFLLAISLMAMAQTKLTPQAQMKLSKEKVKVERKAARAKANGQAPVTTEPKRVTLVVKVNEENLAGTFDQLRAAGAVVNSRLGQQAVISVPIDSVESIDKIKGVIRIDVGHKPKFKTDVTIKETGVSKIDGTIPGIETPFTGKDVTVCLVDIGFDFQHPAFKDAEGNSRIKCVYMMNDNRGNKFVYHDPEIGDIEFPGSVFDTPELISTLTTDYPDDYHGTHTAGIAAGSRSPQGFGGMAPDANIVLIPVSDEYGDEEYDASDIIEQVLAFASLYAEQNNLPMVISASLNSHEGPHNGTGTVPEAIQEASKYVIPVFSAGNEGGYNIHLYRKFTNSSSSFKTLLALLEGESDSYEYAAEAAISCFTRTGNEVGVTVSLISPFTGRALWTSEKVTATPSCEDQVVVVYSEDDPKLATYFDGIVGVAAGDLGNGQLGFSVMVSGGTNKLNLFQLTVSGSDGTEIDMWDDLAGFYSYELPGFVDGDSEMSAGDWTSIPEVISVGAYCSNPIGRFYDGSTYDFTPQPTSTEDDETYTAGDIGWFSSYGTMFNGVKQPVVCAPGVNIVSSWNHYCLAEDETIADGMQWQGYPYGAETGTSMACPVVSGIIALWLQANPNLTVGDVKDLLRETSRNDEFTVASAERFGYGKIDAAKGLEYIATNAIRSVNNTPTSNSGEIYDLQGRRVSCPTTGIYIMDGRKVVVK